MTTHADDQPLHGFGASADVDAPPAGRRSADHGGTLRPRRVPAPEWGRHPSPRDVQRYYLCSEEPSGEFVEVIIPVTDNGRRRYFATSDGERLTEVDEDYFVGRGEGNARSLLELDAREMAELQAELDFVRPVLGRDPLAEVAAEAAAAEAAAAAAEVAAAEVAAEVPEAPEPPEVAEVTDVSEPVHAVPVTDVSEPEHAVPVPDVSEPEPEPEPEPVPADPVPAAPVPPPVAAMQPPTAPMPIAAAPLYIPPPPETPDDSTPVEPPAVETENDDDDDDEETIEENDVVMGTSVFEEVEPVASVPPFAAAPMPVTAPVDAPAHAAPAEPAPAEPTTAEPTPAEATPAVDAAAQVSLAKGIAFVAHRGQLDRVGAEYIDHPGRVAERFDPLTEPVPTAVAWLHDVLEDTAVTAHELLEAGVLPEVVELVQVLTRTPDVADDEYYARIRRHPVALRVKLADLDDNTAPWRVRRLDYDTQVRLAEKYRHAREVLGSI